MTPDSLMTLTIPFDNTYLQLPEAFYSPASGHRTPAPAIAVFNEALARELGLHDCGLNSPQGALVLSGNSLPDNGAAIAMAYAGHQFGHFTNLGDGRAMLLGEYVTPGGPRVDFHLKGSGPTRYSRQGDGKATLGPMLREYLISEGMHGLGVPTSRSLAVTKTGEWVQRETRQPGAVLLRVASSHIRVGTFQYAAALRGQAPQHDHLLRSLADYTLQRHFPALQQDENRYRALFSAVVQGQAALAARWQQVGFIHGVLNTDNTFLSGETVDYGPCAFMDAYSPDAVFSSIDRHGRYRYGQQPTIIGWNLARLAEALLPLFHPEERQALELAQDALSHYPALYQEAFQMLFFAKVGLQGTADAATAAQPLVDSLLRRLQDHGLDFTESFAYLTLTAQGHPLADRYRRRYEALDPWMADWQRLLGRRSPDAPPPAAVMKAHNPCVVPRNRWVEAALYSAVNHDDYAAFHQLLSLLKDPYAYSEAQLSEAFAPEGQPWGPEAYRTTCGT